MAEELEYNPHAPHYIFGVRFIESAMTVFKNLLADWAFQHQVLEEERDRKGTSREAKEGKI